MLSKIIMRAKFKGDIFSRKHEELLQINRKKTAKQKNMQEIFRHFILNSISK